MNDAIFVTGGAGFIGSAVVRKLMRESVARVVTIDALTYSGNVASLAEANGSARHTLERADICDRAALRELFDRYQPRGAIHLAGQSHVDRSIAQPAETVRTNLLGTFCVLEETRRYWSALRGSDAQRFRLLHVSTDEVFDSADPAASIREDTAYAPTTPYAASKAGSDHLVRAWHHTYGLPTLTTNCSTNYGPFQFPEKLIPRIIANALAREAVPVYGRGESVRDWLYVDDHADALLAVFERGAVGETYCIGARSERQTLDVVLAICRLLDELAPDGAVGARESLIAFVEDRPGDAQRCAIDPAKIEAQLGWRPRETFETGVRRTVAWYLANRAWWDHAARRDADQDKRSPPRRAQRAGRRSRVGGS
jgi:dTDP-glucose 4,6-dehydratase